MHLVGKNLFQSERHSSMRKTEQEEEKRQEKKGIKSTLTAVTLDFMLCQKVLTS